MAMLAFRCYGRAELDWALEAIGAGTLARALACWTLDSAASAGSGQSLKVWRADEADQVAGLCVSCEAHVTILQLGRDERDPAGSYLPGVLARALREAGQYRAMLGPAELVRATCAALGPPWHDRGRTDDLYLFLTLDRPAAVRPDPLVRPACEDDFGPLLDASIRAAAEAGAAMGEPTRYFAHYSAIAEAVSKRRYLVRFDGADIVFKAEAVPASADLWLVHNVWIAPSHRRRGISAGAVASAAEYARRSARSVGLFVEADNEPALRCYRRVGFDCAGRLLHATLP